MLKDIGTDRDFVTLKPHAEIKEVENLEKDNENSFRLYCSQRYPGDNDKAGFNLQIRTFKSIGAQLSSKSKPRNMIATVSFTLGELKELVAIAEAQLK